MARATIGRVTFQVTHTPSLERYKTEALAGVPAVMAKSEGRVYEAVKADTPVKTGHMRDNLLKTSDIVPVELEYQVFWRAQEFVGQVNPAGKIIKQFYPSSLILGSSERAAKYPRLLTAELDAERPLLVRDLQQHFARVSR